MAKDNGLAGTPHALDTKHHFATPDEIEGRNKQTRKNHPVNFTQITADANPGMNLAEPHPRNISGDFKLSKSPL
jgi:hypothetical protein